MVDLSIARSTNSKLYKSRPITAVFTGGTGGIGEYSLRALASTHGKDGKGLRIYLVGRKQHAADKIFEDCRKVCPGGNFRFVKCADLSLLQDVDECCRQILEAEAKGGLDGLPGHVDMLVMSHAIFHLGGRMGMQYFLPR